MTRRIVQRTPNLGLTLRLHAAQDVAEPTGPVVWSRGRPAVGTAPPSDPRGRIVQRSPDWGLTLRMQPVRQPACALVMYQLTWGTVAGVEAYNLFAAQQSNAGGGGGGESLVPNGDTLFSWGLREDPGNSRLTWTNTDPLGAFLLERVIIRTAHTDPPILLGSGAEGVAQGIGAAPAWEWSNQAAATQMIDAKVQITVGSNPAVERGLFSGFLAGQTWYDTGNTLLTPVSFVWDASDLEDAVVGPNGSIAFRLYEAVWDSDDQDMPDLVLAPLAIEIIGRRC